VHPRAKVKIVRIHYRAHNGAARGAYVIMPSWYRPGADPPLPLVISPHGRGVSAHANTALWGVLPARGSFLVVSPDGEGRKLPLYSWGSFGQIDDLARMPTIIHLTLPWVHVDHRRIYAVGGSMGGQEALLLLARHHRLLAGVAAFDAVTDFARQYRSFPRIACGSACRKIWNGPVGVSLQSLAREEIGGSPQARPAAYAERSPVTYVRAIATSCVPLELWWSVHDRVVLDQRAQSGALYKQILSLNPDAPVEAYIGYWNHSAEMHAKTRLPAALSDFGLLPPVSARTIAGLHFYRPLSFERGCVKPEPARVAKASTRSRGDAG
jgi:pimeloyl-ACP methyl ester carboxylesterase